jgi:long-chain acyl-CoA synthetase
VDAVPPEIKYILEHSEASFTVAHDQEQVDKILGIGGELPQLRKIVYWDPRGLWFYNEPLLMDLDRLEQTGREFEISHPSIFDELLSQGSKSDCAIISYTSGTTGFPKGVMLTHETIIANRKAWLEVDPCYEGDNYLSFLSPAWAAEQYLGVAGGLLSRFVVNFPEAAETLQDNIREIEPQVLFYGARQWENIHAMVNVRMSNAARVNRVIYRSTVSAAYKFSDRVASGGRQGRPGWGLLNILCDALAFKPLRNKLGLNKVRYAYIGGAGVSPEIIRFFHVVGINIKQIYGLSETGVNACHRDGEIDPSTTGPPLPHNEIRVSTIGEILLKTDSMFVGYYRDPDGRKGKVDSGGWFHTGDFGHINENGHLIVIDRLGDLKELGHGEKYSPQFTEVRLRFSPYIRDAVVVGGERHGYVTVIINIDFDNVAQWAEANHISYTTFLDISQRDEVAELIKKDITDVNRVLPEGARVRRFVCLHKEFDPDEAELTRTRKIRRSFVERRYENIITGMYSPVSEVPVESEVTYQDGRKSVIRASVKVRTIDNGFQVKMENQCD